MLSKIKILIVFIFLNSSLAFPQNVVDSIIDQGVERISENKESQKKVDVSHGKTLSLIEEYEDNLKILDGLTAYNAMMDRQVTRQELEMDQLRTSITDVSIIERQILPLLSRMIDGLEQFIRLDMPFLLDERSERVTRLRNMLERVDVTVAEKSRRVFEAYQIEVSYGRTIEAYRSKLALEKGTFDVDYLRVGRTALLYRTLGTGDLGFWNKERKQWDVLSGSSYRRYFDQGIQIARQELAPDLISIPVIFEGEK